MCFSPEIINSLTIESKLMAMPYSVNFTALYYNKDNFDRFGIAYPKDGMTWDDTIELGKKLTRLDNGIQYRGIDPESVARLSRVIGIHSDDYKTNKASVDTNDWRNIFDIYKKAYSIPGNMPSSGKPDAAANIKEFLETKTLAMLPTVNRLSRLMETPPENRVNWDVAQYPSMPGKPGISTDVDAHIIAISETSKNKDAAMRVIEILTSDDVQMIMTRKTARQSPLKDPKFKEAFALDLDIIKGKNITGIFKGRIIEAPIRSSYGTMGLAEKHVIEYFKGTEDLNTAIRKAEEEINNLIATKSKK